MRLALLALSASGWAVAVLGVVAAFAGLWFLTGIAALALVGIVKAGAAIEQHNTGETPP